MNKPFEAHPPASLKIVGILLTIGGAWSAILALTVVFSFFAFSIGTLGLGLLTGPLWLIPIAIWGVGSVIGLINGIKCLSGSPTYSGLMGGAIALMVCLLMCDVVAFAIGLISLILILQGEVKRFFGKA